MPSRLCVTNIGFHITETDLREYFCRFGQITECKLKTDANTGESRGFAFLTFSDDQSARKCLQLTSHRIQEKAVNVFSDSQTQESPNFKVPRSKKLFISLIGLRGVSEMDIHQTFSQFGQISSIEIDRENKIGEALYCIVYFTSYEPVDVCVARSHCIQGRQVVVRRAVSREEVKLAEQRERELQAAKAQAKKVYGIHCPTQNVTIVQSRLFSSMPSMLSEGGSGLQQPQESRKRPHDQSSQAKTLQNSSLAGYGYI